MINPITFIFGYERLIFKLGDASFVMNICMSEGIVYRNPKWYEDSISLECSLRLAKKLKRLCLANGIEPISSKEYGFPNLLGRYRHRYGIFLGAAIFSLLIFLSGRFIWDIRIDGAKSIPHSEIIKLLEKCGIERGSPINKLDVDSIQNRVIIASDEISWISINIIGTVAHVEIRESQVKNDTVEYEAANLVATADGQIEYFEDVRGNIVTRVGDYVREGELLVGGIFDSSSIGFRYTAAKGKVMARTEEKYHIEIPLKYTKKSFTGKKFSEKYLIFFNNSIKFYSNSRKIHTNCDTIDTVEFLNLMSDENMPFGIRTVSHLEYEYLPATRTPEEATELALYKLRALQNEGEDRYVISQEYTTTLTEDKYIIDLTVVCIKNIAKQIEIKLK